MPVPPIDVSSSIDSASSFGSSKSSLLAPPLDDVSSQSDVADAIPHSMPPGDAAAYAVAASPPHPTSSGFGSSASNVSTTQKLKRAFGKRRRPSQDAGLLLSSGDERQSSDIFTPSPSSHYLSSDAHGSTPNRPKLTMHLFGARRHHEPSRPDPNLPPPLPPKPPGLRAPHPSILQISSNNAHSTRPRSSVMLASPSITAAIEFMREDDERQRVAEQERERLAYESRRELDENKEKWRKSDSTMGSGHTVRPANNTTDPGSGVVNERLSAYLATSAGGGHMDLLEFLAGAPEPEGPAQNTRSNDTPTAREAKRRSLSLNIHVPSTHTLTPSLSVASVSISTPSHRIPPPSSDPGALPDTHSQRGHTFPLTSSPPETPVTMHTFTNGMISSGSASGSPVLKTNVRGRLAALTAPAGASHPPSPLSASAASTSTPSLTNPSMTSLHQTPHRRVIVTSDATRPSAAELQAMAAVRQLQNRVRSPSASSTSSSASIRQAATSLTSGAGAMALGLGKRAYEKVGRVWGGSQSGSGSGSDTPNYRHPSPVNSYAANTPSGSTMTQHFYNQAHGPSAFPLKGRRTPATSGSWSVSSMGGSRSSSEKDRAVSGPEFASLAASSLPVELGRLVRPPRVSVGGIVFGKDLWICVKDTRAVVTGLGRDPLGERMIPALVYRCAQHLHKWGLEEEGLFRISGRSSHISRLRNEFDGGADYDITDCSPSELDPHAVASVFKAYLRELPEPVLTRSLGPSFDSAMSAESSHGAHPSTSGIVSKSLLGGGPGLPVSPRSGPVPTIRRPPSLSTFTLPTSSSLRSPSPTLIGALGDLITRLPQENRDLLLTVVELMNATAARSKETKMPLSNLLLVFCPSLSMSPTLLRVLCDVPAIWEQPSPVTDTSSSAQGDNEAEETDESTSGSDSELEDGDLDGTQLTVPKSDLSSDIAEDQTDEILVPRAASRLPRLARRVHVPTLYIDNKQMDGSHRRLAGPITPPVLSDSQLHSGSTPSLDIPSRSRTPLSSPMRSEVSLNSTNDKNIMESSPGQHSPSSQSSMFVPWLSPKSDKALPPFPRSPLSAPVSSPVTQEEAQLHTGHPLDVHHSKESVDDLSIGTITLPRSPKDVNPKRSVLPMFKEINSDSAPQLRLSKDTHPERSLSLPTPLVLASKSAPNVVFPSSPKTTPSTPTSFKKHALTLSLGRSPKMSDDEDQPSPSKRPVRRPSLNMLLNLKRGGSPQPRTPTISSPLAMASFDRVPHTSSTFPSPLPPVLTLPIEGGIDVGLGWDDVFGRYEDVATTPARRPTVPQPSAYLPGSQLASPSHQPTTEYPTSNSYFSSKSPPLVLSSPTSVLEVEKSAAAMPSSVSPTSAVFQADPSSIDDRRMVEFPKQPSPVAEPRSPPPHINIQLRRSSLEDEDWASIVLLAAGRPPESLA